MATLLRCIRSDFHKFRHTCMLLIHILIPIGAAGLFLLYFIKSPWQPILKLNAFLSTIAIGFPLIAGLICGITAEQEAQAGSFQVMMRSIKSRGAMYASKLIILISLSIFSVILAVGLFGVGFRTAPALFYLKAIGVLAAGSAFLYILHLFISFQFGSGATIALGIAEGLIAFIMKTGLGDGKWYYIPCAWGARMCDNLVNIWGVHTGVTVFNTEIEKGLIISISAACIAFVASIIWFCNWEGRKSYD